MENQKSKMENYVFMEQDKVCILYPLSFTELEIQEFISYLDNILDHNSKVEILTPELSATLYFYFKDKNVELYVPNNIYNQIEKLSASSRNEDTKYKKLYKI